jgi:hypothetical protein
MAALNKLQVLKSCDLKTAMWLAATLRTVNTLIHEAQARMHTQLRPVAVPNNAAPNRGLISNRFDFRNKAASLDAAANSAITRALLCFVAVPFQIVLRQICLSIIRLCAPSFKYERASMSRVRIIYIKICVHLSVLRCVWSRVGGNRPTFVIFCRTASEQWARR